MRGGCGAVKRAVSPLSSRRLALLLLISMSAACALVGMGRLEIRCCVSKNGGATCDDDGPPPTDVLVDGGAAGSCEDWEHKTKFVSAGSHRIAVRVRSIDRSSACCFGEESSVDVAAGGRTKHQALLVPFPH